MLEAFKIKPFELEPVYASWAHPPIFQGNPKKDPSVDDWLEQIKAGCVERKVPEEYWHKVAQNYMGKKAKARLDELKIVLAKINGGKYRWSWKRFGIAMHNMGWDIDSSATQTVKVEAKPTNGGWWLTRKDTKKDADDEHSKENPKDDSQRPNPVKAKSENALMTWRGNSKPPSRSNTMDSPNVMSKPALPSRSSSLDVITRPRPSRSNSVDSGSNPVETLTTVTNAPIWLLNACNALDFLTAEHPKAMSALSAILITAGTLPAIPAISAGAGGAILASGAAQAVGAIAVSVGSWIKAQQEGQVKAQQQGQIEASTSK